MSQVRSRLASRRAAALLGVVAAFVIAPAAASAGTLAFSGTQVSFVAAPGEANAFSTSPADDFNFFVNDAAPITIAPGSPCDYYLDLPNSVICQTNTAPTSFNVQLGDGNDTGDVVGELGTTNSIDLGPGDDDLELRAPGARNAVTAGPGNDDIRPDLFFIGPNNPPAADAISGGEGTDRVSYANTGRVAGITVTLDGSPDDGSPGEGDNVGADVEAVDGTDFGDRLVGGPGPNELNAYDGDDQLTGGGGGDQLDGGIDDDEVSGGDGDDTLEGGVDDDRLEGGSGFDSFIGDLSAGTGQVITGNDTIRAQDGVQKEPISCGPGADTAIVDPGDLVSKDPLNACESVKKGSPKPTPCAKAKTKLKKAKAALKKAKKSGTPAKVKQAKKTVKKAAAKVKKAC